MSKSARLEQAIAELKTWLPSETDPFRTLVYDILWGLSDKYPEELGCVDLGITTDYQMGWKEADLLAKVLDAIQDRDDLEKTLKELYTEEKEE